MHETLYSARSPLRHPVRFIADAVSDLRRSPGIAWRLFRRNMQARYRRAWLGYLWLLLPSIGSTLVWGYVKSRQIVGIGSTDVPYPVYVFSGTVLWQVFVESFNAPLQQLTAGRQLITRSRVPHEALILAGVLEVVLNAAVRLLLLLPLMVAFSVPIGPQVLLVPFGLSALVLLGLALGILVAPVGMLYDDVSRGIALVAGFWFFLTPVVYPASSLGVLRLNPVTPLLDTTRNWLTCGHGVGSFGLVTGLSTITLVAALLLERLARPHVVARLG